MSGTPDYIELLLNTSMLHIRSRTICCKILSEVRDGVAGDLHGGGGPGIAGGKLGEDSRGMVHEVGLEARILDLPLRQVPGQLMNDGPHHFQMPQFLCADCGSAKATTERKPCAAKVTGRKKGRKRKCAK